MNAFLKKLKTRSKVMLIIYIVVLLLYLVSSVFITINLLSLKSIETPIRIIAILTIIYFAIIYLIFGFLSIMDKRKITFILLTILAVICIPVLIVASSIIGVGIKGIKSVNKEYTTYKTSLVILKDTNFNKKSTIGIISNEGDIIGNILPLEYLDKNKMKNELIYYDDYIDMLADLYDKKIDSLFISPNYVAIYESEETFENIDKETKIYDSYSKKMKNQDNSLASNKSLDEPFTILIMGVDSEINGLDANQAFNGDTLMLITFNPVTLNATMFSIPRDMYVPIACRNGAKAKINSSAAYGTECVIDTIEQFTDIEIDYYVKINFKGVVDLVDALGGVEVEVGKDFCEQDSNREWGNKTICLKAGYQKLNGEQALAFSRHRHTLLRGDIDRIQNQQKVVEALLKKVKTIRSFNEFQSVLDSITNNMLTNMSKDQILSSYSVFKDMIKNSLRGNDFITIDKTYLEYYDLPVRLAGTNTITSALGYYSSSLEEIKALMKNNLSTTEIVTYSDFKYTYKEEYQRKIYGKGLTGSRNDVTMPKLIGRNVSDASYIAKQNGLVVNVETVSSESPNYDSRYGSGIVSDQSIPYGSILGNNKTVTLYVNE